MGGREEGREGGCREASHSGEPNKRRQGGAGSGVETPQLGVHQASQGPTTQGPVLQSTPSSPSLCSLRLFPNLPGVQCHLEETHRPEGTHPHLLKH